MRLVLDAMLVYVCFPHDVYTSQLVAQLVK
jgi:hypothetical protein